MVRYEHSCARTKETVGYPQDSCERIALGMPQIKTLVEAPLAGLKYASQQAHESEYRIVWHDRWVEAPFRRLG